MPQTKHNRPKIAHKTAKLPAPKAPETEEPSAAIGDPLTGKGKRAFDFVEEEEAVLPADKSEDAPLLGDAVAEEEAEDEASLDEEELNPFGDKWEQ